MTNVNLNTKYAFPGAIGYGKNTTGGRGGIVYHVTSLNDSNTPGTLRYGLESLFGPRIIVFDVGGDIIMNGASPIDQTGLRVPKSSNDIYRAGDITIMGQTAPSPGITLKENGVVFYGGNLILRYLTIRSSDNGAAINQDSPGALTFRCFNTGDSWNGTIVDHLTLSHAGNENLAIGADSPDFPMLNTTISNSMIGVHNGDGTVLSSYNTSNLSFIQNYIHHSERRNPLISGAYRALLDYPIEYINNINYGAGGLSGDRTVKLDILYNVFKSTANMPTIYHPYAITANQKLDDGVTPPFDPQYNRYYHEGNVVEAIVRTGNANTGNINNELADYNSTSRRAINSLYNDYLTNAEEIKAEVFSHVGNSLYRDSYDQQKIDDYAVGTGNYSLAGKPSKTASVRPNGFYGSNPDIPVSFVNTHGITSNNQVKVNWDFGTYTVTNNAGYTALEIYFAYVAKDLDRLANTTGTVTTPPVQTPVSKYLFKKNTNVLFLNS